MALLLALVTLAAFLPTVRHEFSHYDDGDYVVENTRIHAGVTWAGVQWAFTTVHASNWHPITWLSHMVDCGLYGLNPVGHHLTNALFHAANAALLFLLMLRWLGTRALPGGVHARWPALFVAALFAWHPMHVESVAWVAERKDVLSTFFALLALGCYTRHAQDGGRFGKFYFLALLFFALGLMSKPMLVTLPCVLLLLDVWPLNRLTAETFRLKNVFRLLLEKIPFFVLTAGACIVTLIAQSRQGGNAVVSLETVSLVYRLKNVPVAYAQYLWKTFWPADLAVFYPLPLRIPLWEVAVAVALLLVISLIAVWRLRTQPWLAVGWCWFLGMLVPVIGLVQVGSAQYADRYHYLPSVGIFLVVTLAALELAARWRWAGIRLGVVAAVILLATFIAMERQLYHWRSNIALFQHALDVAGNNDIAQNNLGIALEKAGRLTEAEAAYRAAAKLAQKRFQAHHNLARVLTQLGRYEEALVERQIAAQLAPEKSFLHSALAGALAQAGQTQAALAAIERGIAADAKDPLPYVERAQIYFGLGRDAEAVDELRTALRLAPQDVSILIFTALKLAANENAAARDGNAAFALAVKANLLSNGGRVDVLDVLGMACAEIGRFDEARLAAQSALERGRAAGLKGLEPIEERLRGYQAQ